MVRLHDLNFRPFIAEADVLRSVEEMAARISTDYQGLDPILVPILNGAFVFAADLVRRITIPCQVSFIKVASYELTESKGEVEEILGLPANIAGRHILLLEDIVDTGLTMQEVVKSLQELQPASVNIATLLLKPASLRADVPVRYEGFRIGPEFVVGYGMDYDGLGRNLPSIHVLDAR